MADDSWTLEDLRTLRGLVDELALVLEGEYTEITTRADAAAIEATAHEKLRLFEAIGACEVPRAPENTAALRLRDEWRALRQSLAVVHRRNERNGIAIARVLDTVGEEIALLTGRERAGETYGPGGETARVPGRLHASA